MTLVTTIEDTKENYVHPFSMDKEKTNFYTGGWINQFFVLVAIIFMWKM